MNQRTDLTRWNRAGLPRFRYVDGNAVNWFHELRLRMAHELPAWTAIAPEGDTSVTRLLADYYDRRGEYGWEMLRTMARSLHVLLEHVDAYANECTLDTATQWDSLRKLVAMLDYRPAPPSSASVALALILKPGLSGLVTKGLPVKFAPPEGGNPLVFETLASLEADARLNELRHVGWNCSSRSLRTPPGDFDALGATWDLPTDARLSAGQFGIVRHVDDSGVDKAAAVVIEEIDAPRGKLLIRDPASAIGGTEEFWDWKRGTVEFLCEAAEIRRPRLNGANVIHTTTAHGLVAGDTVGWGQGNDWNKSKILETDEFGLRLEEGIVPPVGAALYRVGEIRRTRENLDVPDELLALWDGTTFLDLKTEFTRIDSHGSVGSFRRSTTLALVNIITKGAPVVAVVADEPTTGTTFVFDGAPGRLASGQWLVVVTGTEKEPAFEARRIREIDPLETAFAVTFSEAPAGRVLRMIGGFKRTIRPVGHDRNDDRIAGLDLDLIPPPDVSLQKLVARRQLLILYGADRDPNSKSLVVRVEDVVGNRVTLAAVGEYDDDVLTFLETSRLTVGNLVVSANVVVAGHGESKPRRVLGSGDATRPGLEFTLSQSGVSFCADPAFPHGVRADLELSVDDQIWRQVANLRDSEPDEPHYSVAMTEDGFLRIIGGDGVHGRVFPSGFNNVAVRFRSGNGRRGNIGAWSLERLVQPHFLVAAVRQPLAATGGSEMESVESIRDNAPRSVLTLERAVSLSDYAALASTHSGVWQAAALPEPDSGGIRHVNVVVVPAEGGELLHIRPELKATLEQFGLPDVRVTITPYESHAIGIDVKVSIRKKEFDERAIEHAIRDLLLERISLQRRKLGQPLYLSEIYGLIERVRGVEFSRVRVFDGTAEDEKLNRQVIKASSREVVYLDPSARPAGHEPLAVTCVEFAL